MKASIGDVGTLKSLRPLEVAAYLRAAGWREVSSAANKWSTWLSSKVNGEEAEIVLPLDHTLGDFALRMGDVLATLEAIDERDQIQILHDLLTTSSDVIRVRIGNGELGGDSIPIEEGVQLVHKARDMMMAAACSAADPRAFFPTRKPGRAVDYVRRLRLGQTERGSYVVTMLSGVAPMLSARDAGQLLEIEDPFERQVTRTLHNALCALRSAAADGVSTGEFTAFRNAVRQGVSANLCDAIVGMSDTGEGSRDLDIGFSWSRSRPPVDRQHKRVLIAADAMPVIGEAARYFKETSPREEFELRGPVVKLERAEGAETGVATVLGFVDDEPRKVSFELPDEAYHVAVQAHDNQQVIVCYGILTREGRSYRLRDARLGGSRGGGGL